MHLPRWTLALLLAGAVLPTAGDRAALAAGGPPRPVGNPPAAPPPTGRAPAADPAPPAPTPSQVLGTRLFDEAIRWVARGKPGLGAVKDFHVRLFAKLDLGNTHSEGPMRLWLEAPDRYRQELTVSNRPHVKILNQGRLWIAGPDGKFVDVLRTADGASALQQANEDLTRLRDLTAFLTLEGLKGPDVTFESEGETPGRNGAGTSWKVVRKAPGRPVVRFWLAFTRDAAGVVHATYPGVVRIDGDPEEGTPTEDYVLQNWDDPPGEPERPFRHPRKIIAFQVPPAPAPAHNFLTAVVEDIRLNATIDAALFRPPP